MPRSGKMLVSSVKATKKVPFCSHFGWLDDCKSDCHQIMKPFHTCLVLDLCTSQQTSPAELAQRLGLLFSCSFCLQGTSPFSQRCTKACEGFVYGMLPAFGTALLCRRPKAFSSASDLGLATNAMTISFQLNSVMLGDQGWARTARKHLSKFLIRPARGKEIVSLSSSWGLRTTACKVMPTLYCLQT